MRKESIRISMRIRSDITITFYLYLPSSQESKALQKVLRL